MTRRALALVLALLGAGCAGLRGPGAQASAPAHLAGLRAAFRVENKAGGCGEVDLQQARGDFAALLAAAGMTVIASPDGAELVYAAELGMDAAKKDSCFMKIDVGDGRKIVDSRTFEFADCPVFGRADCLREQIGAWLRTSRPVLAFVTVRSRDPREEEKGLAALAAGDADTLLAQCAQLEAAGLAEPFALRCAYALALAGLTRSALASLDRAAAGEEGRLCVAAEVFALAGDGALAADVGADAGSCPGWLSNEAADANRRRAAPARTPAPPDRLARLFEQANQDGLSGRSFRAAGAFREVAAAWPFEPAPLLGCSLALEEAGARRAALRAAEDALLVANDDGSRAEAGRQVERLKLPAGAQPAPAPASPAEGRHYVGFLGGSLARSSSGFGGGLSGHAGILLGPALDAGIDLGVAFSPSATFSLGVSTRARTPAGAGMEWVYALGAQASAGAGIDFGLNLGAGVSFLMPGRGTVDLLLVATLSPSAGIGASIVAGATLYQ